MWGCIDLYNFASARNFLLGQNRLGDARLLGRSRITDTA
jgi:hypothetical protein